MEIRGILENSIKTALWSLNIDESKVNKINLEHPEDLSHGDYSCNIAMVLAKQVAQNPKELAEKIIAVILENKPNEIEKVEVAGPGFINFYLTSSFFVKEVKEILNKKEKFGLNKNFKGEKTVVEYTDPNPFKEFHIGHLMSNAIGEAVSRVVEANGARVIRACYQGDVGLHVAKTIWGAKEMLKQKLATKREFFGSVLGAGKNPRIWGKAYSFGATNYEDNEIAKKEIVDINKSVYLMNDPEVNKLYKVGRKVSLAEFEKIYKVLGTKFNKYFFESETTPIGLDLVKKNLAKGVFVNSDGAVVFKGEDYGLHTRVFINSEGLPTYEAKELGLAKYKYDKTGYEKSIIITANEQSEYFKVLLKALSLIYPELAAKTKHISHGILRLPTGKMGSRTGNVITAISLIDEIKEKVLEKMMDRDMSKKEKESIAEKISIGALKYSILKQVNGKDIIFDFDKSISFEGDSGPYLQYSYARAQSILRKAKVAKIHPVKWNSEFNRVNQIKADLERILYRFPEVVERAGDEYSPHYIATYLIELASAFNSFYAEGKIIDKEDVQSPYKIAITEAFSTVLKNGLNLLGIDAPNRM